MLPRGFDPTCWLPASPYIVEEPDGPEHADFHALRHSYLTLGRRAGIDLRILQVLAGHSTPVLTARYSHVRLNGLAGAVDRLPAMMPEGDSPYLPLTYEPDGKGREATATNGITLTVTDGECRHNPLIGKAPDGKGRQPKDYTRRESNPQPTVPKTVALSN